MYSISRRSIRKARVLLSSRTVCNPFFAAITIFYLPTSTTVSRIIARGVTYEMELVIDIQTELYPLKTKDKFTLALASTLDMSGKPDDGRFNQSGEATLLDKFDYGMHGKVFRYDLIGDHRV